MTTGGSGDQGGFDSGQFALTALVRSDVETLMPLFQPLAVRFALTGLRAPMSGETLETWIAETMTPNARPARLVHGVRKGSTLAGLAILNSIDWLHRSATLAFFPAGTRQSEHAHQAAVAHLVRLAFRDLRLHRLQVQLAPGADAHGIYAAQGFQEEGRRRGAHFDGGVARDLLVMAKLNTDAPDAQRGSAPGNAGRPVAHQIERMQKILHRLPWPDLALTPVEATDTDAFHAMQNDPALRDAFMGYRMPVSRGDVSRWINNLGADGHGRARYAIRFRDRLVGTTLLTNMDPVNRCADIGLQIMRADDGRGLGTMAFLLAVDFGFNALGLRRIEIETSADNISTINSMKRLGFTLEACPREAYFVGGVWQDTHVFGLLAEEMVVHPGPGANRLVGG